MSKSKKATAASSRASREAGDDAKDLEAPMSESEGNKPYESKIHAVELALEALGWNAMPAEIQKYLRDRFKLDMTTAHIGVNKTNVLRRRGIAPGPEAGAGRGRPRRGAA